MSEKRLEIIEFGAPVLRQSARHLSLQEIKSPEIQQLIRDMRYTLTEQKLGIALAAPQVGKKVSVTVVALRPTKHRPEIEPLELVVINPKITKTFGYRTQIWEGCISSGNGQAGLFAKTPRYKKVEAEFIDETGKKHRTIFEGLPAQIIQHETDHLSGVLFVDHVKDTKTYMTMKEYKKMISAKEV